MRRKSNGKRRNGSRVSPLDEFVVSGFSNAFHSHIEEIAYELQKDPEYQQAMRKALDRLLVVLRSKNEPIPDAKDK